VGVFKELKKELSSAAEQRWAKMPAGFAISKRDFIGDLAEARIKSMKAWAVEKGWEGAGIWPSNGNKAAPYLDQQQHLQATPSSQAALSPKSQARRLHHTDSLESRHQEVLAEHAINTPAPCKVYIDKATQLALALKANIVILKRQLAETEFELLKERRACSRPCPLAQTVALSTPTSSE
jgi:hypothetical protein